ncbi:hypothetical protein [Flavobacterium xanthum]|uniref:Uncharacterized protein n=1 Tax=Flavobacterium xanthum TaxID=69322 RepID=A0A1M6XAQ3_9FLAO|nr:hypothetical protein [Flavobacterium xanthum]SHL02855.1 hypothetical protein SAMN05443669_1001185 [Flavobacterium xanthum]
MRRKNKFVPTAMCIDKSRPIRLNDLKKLTLEESLALEQLIVQARHLKAFEKEYLKKVRELKLKMKEE